MQMYHIWVCRLYWSMYCMRHGIRLISIESIREDVLTGLLKESDVALTAGICQKFSSKQIHAARGNLINFHYAPLPYYRGTHSVFWQKVGGDHDFGYCFHKVDEKIDHGTILFQKRLRIPFEYSVSKICDLLTDHATFQLSLLVTTELSGLPQDEKKANYFSSRAFEKYLHIGPGEKEDWVDKIKYSPVLIWDKRYILHFGKAEEHIEEAVIYIKGLTVIVCTRSRKIPIISVNYLPAIFYFRSIKRIFGTTT